MRITGNELSRLNDALSKHIDIILRCTSVNKKHGRLLLASPPTSRYPYVYTRDSSCAVQLFRRIAGSENRYDTAEDAYSIMKSMANFMKDTISREGSWGQRYSEEGVNKSIYKQEDNVAHGISIICNYMLTAEYLKRDIEDLDGFLMCVDRALDYSRKFIYEEELNLFYSTTSIHESAMEQGYTCWVNFSFLYAFSLASEVAEKLDKKNKISTEHLSFRKRFYTP